jgi:6-pyruvoyltetrahydropterin/6-carboxytetrahydropterin synthase
MNTVTKRLEWDSGHRVLGHRGKCRHLHGHRYAAEITVQSPDLDGLGMVVDFGVIKERVGGWIDQSWDHNLLLHPDDPLLELSNKQLQEVCGDRLPYVMPPPCPNPTAENIARVLYDAAVGLLDPLKVVEVTVWETPTCRATYRPDN